MPGRRIWTIGHSTRSGDDFVALLLTNEISGIADVRTIPRSKRHPHFAREALQNRLREEGIDYRHFAPLGGLRKPKADSTNTGWRNASFRGYADHMQSPDFAEAMDQLVEFGDRARIAIMCAEAVWWQCHRMLVSDALVARGVDVQHILGRSAVQPHRLTPFARIEQSTSGDNPPRVWYPGLL